MKNLYVSPVGNKGKKYLKKIIKKFGYQDFDYLIFVYDDTKFNEKIFQNCKFICEKGKRWYFMKKYATPEYCKEYDYIFVWPDDIDIDNFSYKNFIDIMERNNLEMAQPALSHKSHYSHSITLKQDKKLGRLTDFVEIMVPVFSREAWSKFYEMMEDYNYCGWGYDDFAKSFCRYKNMGIVDCETVTHVSSINYAPELFDVKKRLFREHKNYEPSKHNIYGELR